MDGHSGGQPRQAHESSLNSVKMSLRLANLDSFIELKLF